MASLRRHEGYLLIDNRFGPGVSADLVRRSGKDAPIVGEGQTLEVATLTCSHCHQQMMVNPLRTRDREYCPKCDHYLCDRCGLVRKLNGGDCLQLNAVLDKLQNDAAILIGKG